MKRKKKPQIEVLEIFDLEKEYQLVHARLKLFKVQQASTAQSLGIGTLVLKF